MFSKARNPGAIRVDINTSKSKKEQAEKTISRLTSEIEIVESEIIEIDNKAAESKAWLAKHLMGRK